jgi:hypothetical protein
VRALGGNRYFQYFCEEEFFRHELPFEGMLTAYPRSRIFMSRPPDARIKILPDFGTI